MSPWVLPIQVSFFMWMKESLFHFLPLNYCVSEAAYFTAPKQYGFESSSFHLLPQPRGEEAPSLVLGLLISLLTF